MKVLKLLTCLFFISQLFISCAKEESTTLKVLQLNLWHQGQKVPEGVPGIVDVIDQTDPDVVLMCELTRDEEQQFVSFLVDELEKRGKKYISDNQRSNVAILSKYIPTHSSLFYPTEDPDRPILKVAFDLCGQTVVVYSLHLDYTHYECYLPRGYSGTTWQKMDYRVANADSVLEANRISLRDEAIAAFLADAAKEKDKGNLVIMGGDFNEPSHLDWQEDTKDLFDHNGLVINWDCSVMLYGAGYKDAFREIYPDPVKRPGFTFPAGNVSANLKDLTWAPEADERDRIDFIYYYPTQTLTLEDAFLVGPSETVSHGQIIDNDTEDTFIEPKGIWPTDHKGNLAIFRIK